MAPIANKNEIMRALLAQPLIGAMMKVESPIT